MTIRSMAKHSGVHIYCCKLSAYLRMCILACSVLFDLMVQVRYFSITLCYFWWLWRFLCKTGHAIKCKYACIHDWLLISAHVCEREQYGWWCVCERCILNSSHASEVVSSVLNVTCNDVWLLTNTSTFCRHFQQTYLRGASCFQSFYASHLWWRSWAVMV